nr:hypothetical protein [Tanacetum cinerariifolium]
MAFVSSNSISSFNEADTTASGVSTAHTQDTTVNSTSIDNLSDAMICAFLASQSNSSQLAKEDLEKIGKKVLKRTVGTSEETYEPTSAEEKLDRRNEMKSRGTLIGNKVLKRTVGTSEETYEPTSAEEKLDRRNEMKSRGTLLMALPKKHQLKFHSYQH